MQKIPTSQVWPSLPDLNRIHMGKVRDTYELPGFPDHLLVVATDRISIFDFVLNATVPYKGQVLTALNIFWRNVLSHESGEPFRYGDLIACGSGMNAFLPAYFHDNASLQRRAIVVSKLNMLKFEGIVRGYLTGSGWSAYKGTNPHVVCGHTLPDGLIDGSRLPTPLFTPTTKAEVGHDEHMDVEEIRRRHPTVEEFALRLYGTAADFARRRGIVIADTKFEFGTRDGVPCILGDEILTPDSSRFWDMDDYVAAQAKGKSPQGYDKQFVREWGKIVGIDKLNPTKPEDLVAAQHIVVPDHIIEQTTALYLNAFQRLTGNSLEEFQVKFMRCLPFAD